MVPSQLDVRVGRWDAAQGCQRTAACLSGGRGRSCGASVSGGLAHTSSSLACPILVTPGFGEHWSCALGGRSGSEAGKFVQGYSPVSHVIKATGDYCVQQPTTMKSLKPRKVSLLSLVDSLLTHLQKGQTGASTLAKCHDILDELLEHTSFSSSPLHLKRIPLSFYKDFLKSKLKGASMRDTRPQPKPERAI